MKQKAKKKDCVNIRVTRSTRQRLKIRAIEAGLTLIEHLDRIA